MTKKSSFTLPIRPRPFDGEATRGYLMRVARANGYEQLSYLRTLFSNFEEISQALCLSDSEKALLFGPHPGFWGATLFSKEPRLGDFNHTRLRWCPRCLGESDYLRGLWSVEIISVCTRHKVWLSDQCSSCGNTQGLERVNFERCRCGAELSHSSIESNVHRSVLRLSQALENSLIQQVVCTDLPQLAFSEWIRLITYLGQYSNGFQPSKPGKVAKLYQVDTAKRLMLQTARLLEEWPESFHRLLSVLHRQSAEQLSIRKAFGSLYRTLYTDLSDDCFQFLRDEFEDYLREHWSGVVGKRHRAFKPETIARHPRLAWKQAAKKAGLAPSVLRHLIRAEWISAGEVDLPSGRTQRSIHKCQLNRLTDLAKEGLTLKDAAYQLALPERRVRELIKDDIIIPLVSRIHGNAAAWLIPKGQLQRLHFNGWGINSLSSNITTEKILKHWRLREGEFTALVLALLSGQLMSVGLQTEFVPLGKLVFDKHLVRRWLIDIRDAAGASLSVDEVAKRLGLKQQVVYDLVNAGLLATIQDDLPGRRIMPAALKTFSENYISLAEYARSLNRSPRSVLQSLVIQPVSGPMIDGCRQYFYRRADLCAKESEAKKTHQFLIRAVSVKKGNAVNHCFIA